MEIRCNGFMGTSYGCSPCCGLKWFPLCRCPWWWTLQVSVVSLSSTTRISSSCRGISGPTTSMCWLSPATSLDSRSQAVTRRLTALCAGFMGCPSLSSAKLQSLELEAIMSTSTWLVSGTEVDQQSENKYTQAHNYWQIDWQHVLLLCLQDHKIYEKGTI